MRNILLLLAISVPSMAQTTTALFPVRAEQLGNIPAQTRQDERFYRFSINDYTPINAFSWDMAGFQSFCVQIQSTGNSQNSNTIMGSNDGVSWSTLRMEVVNAGAYPMGPTFINTNSTVPQVFCANKTTRFARFVRNVIVSGSRNEVIVFVSSSPYSWLRTDPVLGNNNWSYVTATGGIVDDTPVTIRAAGAPAIRSVITSMHLTNGSNSVGTEVVIRNGSGGTVIWRDYLPPNGSITYVPRNGLASSGATLLEFACITTGAAVYLFAEGVSTTAP